MGKQINPKSILGNQNGNGNTYGPRHAQPSGPSSDSSTMCQNSNTRGPTGGGARGGPFYAIEGDGPDRDADASVGGEPK